MEEESETEMRLDLHLLQMERCVCVDFARGTSIKTGCGEEVMITLASLLRTIIILFHIELYLHYTSNSEVFSTTQVSD